MCFIRQCSVQCDAKIHQEVRFTPFQLMLSCFLHSLSDSHGAGLWCSTPTDRLELRSVVNTLRLSRSVVNTLRLRSAVGEYSKTEVSGEYSKTEVSGEYSKTEVSGLHFYAQPVSN